MTIYDNMAIKPELQKKINDLKAFCAEHNMPMFVTVAIKSLEDETKYATDQLDPTLLGVELCDNHISEHLKILRGFPVVSKDEPLELDFSELVAGPIMEEVPVEEVKEKPKKAAVKKVAPKKEEKKPAKTKTEKKPVKAKEVKITEKAKKETTRGKK